MSTTNLFVELLVIGMGVAGWILLFMLAFFGYTWLSLDTFGSWNALLPVLAIMYVLGILVDRIADTLLRQSDRQIRERAFADSERDYHYVRTYVFYRCNKFKDIFDYSRSKLRICRSWIFNFAFIAFGTVLFIWVRMPQLTIHSKLLLSVLAFLAGAMLALGSLYTWYRLTDNYYVRLLHAYTVIHGIIQSDND